MVSDDGGETWRAEQPGDVNPGHLDCLAREKYRELLDPRQGVSDASRRRRRRMLRELRRQFPMSCGFADVHGVALATDPLAHNPTVSERLRATTERRLQQALALVADSAVPSSQLGAVLEAVRVIHEGGRNALGAVRSIVDRSCDERNPGDYVTQALLAEAQRLPRFARPSPRAHHRPGRAADKVASPPGARDLTAARRPRRKITGEDVGRIIRILERPASDKPGVTIAAIRQELQKRGKPVSATTISRVVRERLLGRGYERVPSGYISTPPMIFNDVETSHGRMAARGGP